jgi:hypothetical protein
MSKQTPLAAIALVVYLAFASHAMAFDETHKYPNPGDCIACHGGAVNPIYPSGVALQGPHAGYTTQSRTCNGCHSTHAATVDGYAMLPGPTITATCELCHDGTGGHGVYGVLAARGLTVASGHRTETNFTVPGGDESTGGTATIEFAGAGSTLTCSDCHSTHGADIVRPFTTERPRNASDTAGSVSSEMLKRMPTGAVAPTADYGSEWCGGCHAGRVSGSHSTFNHPVDSVAASGAFTYQRLQVVTAANSLTTTYGALGGSNFGYVMPYPRTARQAGHAPICQQCHGDPRSVGDISTGTIAPSEVFRVTSADGVVASDNPRFQIFPHESAYPSLLIETGNDLCTNCHYGSQLH